MISIFAKRAFLNTHPYSDFVSKEKSYKGNGHLQRVSSIIRADQIAEKIGARLNPTEGYVNDVCIYVKPYVKKDQDFKFEGRKNYIDIIDGHNLGQLALKHPEVGVIVCSQADYDTMKSVIPNEIVLIPQHHCNFKRFKRSRNEVKRVGVIGVDAAFTFLPEGLKDELTKRGMELVKFSKFFSREDIINFYLNIDIQIVWRPYGKTLSNPLKIVNAASFGIPTVALDEPAFKEVQGCYIPVETPERLLSEIEVLKNTPDLYESDSKTCIELSDRYHIDNISKLYEELDK